MTVFAAKQQRARQRITQTPVRAAAQRQRVETANPEEAPPEALSNQTMQRLLKARVIQTKLRVSQPGDEYEREADRIADQVMHMQDTITLSNASFGHVAQRFGLKMSRQASVGNAIELQEEDMKQYQEKAMLCPQTNRSVRMPKVTPEVDLGIDGLMGYGQPLTGAERVFFEPRLGFDLSEVRVHKDDMAAESAREFGAEAYSIGSHIVFGYDNYSPGTAAGNRLMAHELAHITQHGSSGDSREGHRIHRQIEPESKTNTKETVNDPAEQPEAEIDWLTVYDKAFKKMYQRLAVVYVSLGSGAPMIAFDAVLDVVKPFEDDLEIHKHVAEGLGIGISTPAGLAGPLGGLAGAVVTGVVKAVIASSSVGTAKHKALNAAVAIWRGSGLEKGKYVEFKESASNVLSKDFTLETVKKDESGEFAETHDAVWWAEHWMELEVPLKYGPSSNNGKKFETEIRKGIRQGLSGLVTKLNEERMRRWYREGGIGGGLGLLLLAPLGLFALPVLVAGGVYWYSKKPSEDEMK